MFALLAFFFKLFFSVLLAILFSYFIVENEKNNLNVIFFSVLGTSLSKLTMNLSGLNEGVSIAILVSMILYLSYSFFNIDQDNEKLLFIFPGFIGFLVGLGLIFESFVLLAFIYAAKNSLAYIDYSEMSSDDNNEENQENIK